MDIELSRKSVTVLKVLTKINYGTHSNIVTFF